MDELQPETRILLARMERCSFLPYRFDEPKIREYIRQIWDLTKTPQPKEIVVCKDIFDERFASTSTSTSARASAIASAIASASASARAIVIASASAIASAIAIAIASTSTRASARASDYDFDWFCGEVELGKNGNPKYIEIMELLLQAKEAGLGYLIDNPDTNILYLAPNPIVRIENNQFHSEARPAIEFATWQGYFLKGVKLEKDLWQSIVSRTIPTDQAIKLENTEHRAVALQYIGGEKLEKDLGGIEIGKDQYGRIVELTKLQDTEGKNYRYYVAIDPSKSKEIYLRCRPDCGSPQAAMTEAYKLGRWGITYQPVLRT